MSPTELFDKHQSVVWHVVNTFKSYLAGEEKAITIDDLQSEGMIALYLASQKFDKQKEVLFETYASRCISNALAKLIFNNRMTIRHPRKVIIGYQKVSQLLNDESTSLDELISEGKITVTERDNFLCFTSTSAQVDSAEVVEEEPSNELDELEAAIKQLNPIQQLIIRMNYGLNDDGKKKTMLEIGKELGLEKGAVSQRKRTIMKKLKQIML